MSNVRLEDLGGGNWAYLQKDGGWGWSNAGLVTDGDEALLVDTLFDEALTQTMLDRFQDAAGVKVRDIGTVVNTHANGDHTHGNGLLPEAEIIASEASAAEMAEFSPAMLAQLKAGGAAGQLGDAGRYFAEIFAPFDFAAVNSREPTHTFKGRTHAMVGDKRLDLIEVGPAHTRGDILVWNEADRTIFTGDILFIEGTPIMWNGPVGNWIAACEMIEALAPESIVPGHGPLCSVAEVREVADYLRFIEREARTRFDAGMNSQDAARDIGSKGGLGHYASWRDAERIAVNVDTLYREFTGDTSPPDALALFGQMAAIYYDER